jgi:hypothetical protein
MKANYKKSIKGSLQPVVFADALDRFAQEVGADGVYVMAFFLNGDEGKKDELICTGLGYTPQNFGDILRQIAVAHDQIDMS